MKYQEALNRIAKYCGANNGSMLEDDLKTLQELVDKETPKEKTRKANGKGKTIDCCPICKNQIKAFDRYCKNCGQALKWSEQ